MIITDPLGSYSFNKEASRCYFSEIFLKHGSYGILFSYLATTRKVWWIFCVTFQQQFVRFGGILNDGEAMLDLRPGDIVSIVTNKGHVYRARSVVLTLGAWAAKFLPRIGVKVPLQVCGENQHIV